MDGTTRGSWPQPLSFDITALAPAGWVEGWSGRAVLEACGSWQHEHQMSQASSWSNMHTRLRRARRLCAGNAEPSVRSTRAPCGAFARWRCAGSSTCDPNRIMLQCRLPRELYSCDHTRMACSAAVACRASARFISGCAGRYARQSGAGHSAGGRGSLCIASLGIEVPQAHAPACRPALHCRRHIPKSPCSRVRGWLLLARLSATWQDS
jgi:hypothetical protein